MTRAVSLLALALVLVLPATVQAHALGAEAKLKDGVVTVEAFYDDDTPAEGVKVVVTGPDGTVAAQGKTDTTGKWTFAAPPAGKYKVVVDGGAGHKATVALTIPDSGKRAAATEPREPAPPDGAVTVSEGPTRSEFTGPMRLFWAVVGLAVIGCATWAFTRVAKARNGRRPPGSGS